MTKARPLNQADEACATDEAAPAVMLWTRAAIELDPGQRQASPPRPRREAPAAPLRAPPAGSDYLARQEALAVLGVKRQTLYSYVSRGLIRSIQHPDGQESLYLREDIERLKAKSTARSGHGPAAAAAMHWGEPVIASAITEITPRGPRYRQYLALDLARAGHSFEAVCDYLWHEQPVPNSAADWDTPALPQAAAELLAAARHAQPEAHILQLLSQTCLALGMLDLHRPDDVSTAQATQAGRRLIRALTGVFGFLGPQRAYVMPRPQEPLATWLARALGLPDNGGQRQALEQLLVLVADHELNPATFAARIAASGGSQLPACIATGLDVHSGIALGCDQLDALFSQRGGADALLRQLGERLASGHKLPGFNHQLYPDGDPRTQWLLELAWQHGTRAAWSQDLRQVLAEVAQRFGAQPSIEAGLAVFCRALELPPQTAGGLFALSRTAGWVAHVIEQRAAGFMIRPRAKFAGTAR